MNGNFLYALGVIFLVLFLLTLAWELASRFSKEKVPQTETIMIKSEPAKEAPRDKEDDDPYKRLIKAGAKPVEVPDPSPPVQRNIPAMERSAPPAAAANPMPPIQAAAPEPEARPAAADGGIEDPWKSLMQESARGTSSKPKEIPLEIEAPPENNEEKK